MVEEALRWEPPVAVQPSEVRVTGVILRGPKALPVSLGA
jgi:hypothetical protein